MPSAQDHDLVRYAIAASVSATAKVDIASDRLRKGLGPRAGIGRDFESTPGFPQNTNWVFVIVAGIAASLQASLVSLCAALLGHARSDLCSLLTRGLPA